MAERERHSLTILQLAQPVRGERLDRAFTASVARFERLTARGPLKGYRGQLLAEARAAYEGLRRQGQAGTGGLRGVKLSSSVVSLRARTVEGIRGQGSEAGGRLASESRRKDVASMATAEVEDRFCREVIYRLEGELLRCTSRRELLALGQEWGLGTFRANFLMAQVVEAVRGHGLDRQTRTERTFWRRRPGKRMSWKWAAGAAVLLAVAADVLLVRWLGR